MEDRLIIGIDISKEKDKSCMTIARRQGRGYVIVNQLYNKEAEKVYSMLIGKKLNNQIEDEKRRRAIFNIEKYIKCKANEGRQSTLDIQYMLSDYKRLINQKKFLKGAEEE